MVFMKSKRWERLLCSESWQARGGHGLPMSLLFFVGNVKGDPGGEIRKFLLKHLFRAGNDQIAAAA